MRRIAPLAALALGGCSPNLVLFDPSGPIGAAEKSVILIAFALMLIVVIPVIAMVFLFAWRYRASNTKAVYTPNWHYSGKIELVVWLVPALIVIALGILTYKSTYALNPYTPLASAEQPVPVDVVAMNWKWLFIYPEQHIASVNQLVLPQGRPASFRLTSDTVMSSFFIPGLGSQIYAMPGMRTELNLVADRTGTYVGQNFQFSGRGYSSMQFKVIVTSREGFGAWVRKVRQSGGTLDLPALAALEKPSLDNPVKTYAAIVPHLFSSVISRSMTADAGQPMPYAHKGP